MSTREVKIDDQGRKYINLEPHYCGVFDTAVDQEKKYMPRFACSSHGNILKVTLE